MQIEVAGETVMLLPELALYWPRAGILALADVHFGKAAAFRARGVPVPAGTTAQNLKLLTDLVHQYQVVEVVFLGDFLHARAARARGTLDALRAWREQHPQLRLTLVRGNHDLHAGDPPPELRIEVVDEPREVAPFAFCHQPDTVAKGYVLAGHVHPAFRLAGGGDSLRLPCFVFGERRAILPAFGAFTGGYTISPRKGERIFLAAGEAVFEVPG